MICLEACTLSTDLSGSMYLSTDLSGSMYLSTDLSGSTLPVESQGIFGHVRQSARLPEIEDQ